MKPIEDLTENELQQEILSIFNKNSWVMKPNDFEKMSTEERILYQRYEELHHTLSEKYRPKNFRNYDLSRFKE